MDNMEETENTEPEIPIKKEEVIIPLNPGIVEKGPTLRDDVNDMKEMLNIISKKQKVTDKSKKKHFKLPSSVKSKLKKLAKSNMTQVLLLQANGNLKPTTAEIKNGMVLLNGKAYNGSPMYRWLWNGKYPTFIIPEWDINPIAAAELHKQAVEDKRIIDPQTFLIRAMQHAEVEGMTEKKKLSSKAWIIIGVVAVVLAYVLFGKG